MLSKGGSVTLQREARHAHRSSRPAEPKPVVVDVLGPEGLRLLQIIP
jgi:hypothetical protein